jgi:flagellar biosynthesis anti-sigma factor FlgM
MRVDEQGSVAAHGAREAGRRMSGGAAGASPPDVHDRVSLSEMARSLSELCASLGQVDEVREDRVKELRMLVGEGRYRADTRQLVHALVVELLA